MNQNKEILADDRILAFLGNLGFVNCSWDFNSLLFQKRNTWCDWEEEEAGRKH